MGSCSGRAPAVHSLVLRRLPPLAMRLLIFSALLAASTISVAQEPTGTAGCTFEDCAIELDRSIFSQRYLRGGEPVPNVGPFGLTLPSLAPLVADSPEALNYLDTAAREQRRSAALYRAATVVGVLVGADLLGIFPDEVETAGLVGASSLFIATVPFALRANRNRRRAIEVYNASLPR